MNPVENNPANESPKPGSSPFDLQAAYEVMIRSYLRRFRQRQSVVYPTGNEVDHGK